MRDLIAGFSNHIKEAVAIRQKALVESKTTKDFTNVVISGLGGSGIGGSVLADLLSSKSSIPVTVNKDYHIPAFVGPHTLFIACSYSGNTEEILSATKLAMSAGAHIICISSGGELTEIAKENKFELLSMEGGNPPRSMFAYAISFLLFYAERYELGINNIEAELLASADLLDSEEENMMLEAKQIAEKLADKTPVILTIGGLGIAERWRQQFNENAKMLAWQAAIPEMNHNELVGWEGGTSDFAVIYLRDSQDFERNQKRIEIIKEIIDTKTDTQIEIWCKGKNEIQKALYMVHFGDWISFYLSEIRDVDVIDIKSIDLLKSELGKIPVK